jgi:hypothetical protein
LASPGEDVERYLAPITKVREGTDSVAFLRAMQNHDARYDLYLTSDFDMLLHVARSADMLEDIKPGGC